MNVRCTKKVTIREVSALNREAYCRSVEWLLALYHRSFYSDRERREEWTGLTRTCLPHRLRRGLVTIFIMF